MKNYHDAILKQWHFLFRNRIKLIITPVFILLAAFIFLISCSSTRESKVNAQDQKKQEKPTQKPMRGIIYEEGFESGIFPSSLDTSGNSPEIVKVSNAREGNYVMKSVINQSSAVSYRTEATLSPNRVLNFKIGEEYWVGISIKIGEEFRDSVDWNNQGMILQWHYRDWLHPEVRDAQPLVLRYIENEVKVHNEVLQVYMASAPPAYGEWVDWIIHVKFDNEDGIIQIWRNEEQIVDFKGDNHQKEKNEGTYLKFGLYSSQYKTLKPGNFRRVTYHDALRIADYGGSYELVAPRGERR